MYDAELKKLELIKHLEDTKGTIATACIKADVSRKLFYKYYNSDEYFRERVTEVKEQAIDIVEAKLMERIDNGDTTAIIFFLKTRGRKRGYSERTTTEISLHDIDITKLTQRLQQELIKANQILTGEEVQTKNKPDWLM